MSKRIINYPVIGQRIKEERIMLGITQEELAERADISSNYLSHIENGLSKFSFATFVSLINALCTTPNKILCDITENEYICKREIIDYYLDKMNAGQLDYIIKMLEDVAQFHIERKNS